MELCSTTKARSPLIEMAVEKIELTLQLVASAALFLVHRLALAINHERAKIAHFTAELIETRQILEVRKLKARHPYIEAARAAA